MFVADGHAHWLLSSPPDQGSAPPGDGLSNPRLFKVIRVTVHRINRLHLLPLLPSSLSSYNSRQSFPVHLNGKNIGQINKSNSQWAQRSRQDRVPGRNKPRGLNRISGTSGTNGSASVPGKTSVWLVIRDNNIIIGKLTFFQVHSTNIIIKNKIIKHTDL